MHTYILCLHLHELDHFYQSPCLCSSQHWMVFGMIPPLLHLCPHCYQRYGSEFTFPYCVMVVLSCKCFHTVFVSLLHGASWATWLQLILVNSPPLAIILEWTYDCSAHCQLIWDVNKQKWLAWAQQYIVDDIKCRQMCVHSRCVFIPDGQSSYITYVAEVWGGSKT